MKKNVLALQKLTSKTQPSGGTGDGGGSNLTVATCQSDSPSNLSLLLCH